MQKFYVIGISDGRQQFFPPEVSRLIKNGKVFSGGTRHHEILAPLLPDDAEWIDITVPLDTVFLRYRSYREIIVFASGDPLFLGFANTIRRKLPDAVLEVYPYFNSLQLLAHRMLLPYHELKTVSLTGRPWPELDTALINGEKLIGILTDHKKTPDEIARRMLEYGYNNYRITVGEQLGNEQEERIRSFPVEETAGKNFKFPNCLLLERTAIRRRPFGIPEKEFCLLNGRARMITKMPVRMLTLSMLDLRNKTSFWDIGYCTGSVSVEAKLQFPHLQITAFEQRAEGKELMSRNSRKFGTPGITAIIGDFVETDLTPFPNPDAVFIGGHGGRMKEMIEKINTVLQPGGSIVFNSVSAESRNLFEENIRHIGKQIAETVRITVDSHNPIEIMKAL